MKILILSFYYPPDLSAGSFRASALVNALLENTEHDIEIEIVTTQPNRYLRYRKNALTEVVNSRLKINRIKVSEHQSGVLDQAKSFLFYSFGVRKIIKNQNYDLIFATSSRLMTASLGAWIARQKKIPLYLDIRDIFLETMQEALPWVLRVPLKPFFALIEGATIRKAIHVNLVSQGFKKYFRARYPNMSLSFFTNGVDSEFLLDDGHLKLNSINAVHNAPIRILYAGNFGEGQGLHKIIPLLAKVLGNRVKFKLIGDGGRRKKLEAALIEEGVNNVDILPPMSRAALIEEYLNADILFLHLNEYEAFKNVLPSKIFEYAALGKPILAGVSGYAADFLMQEVENSSIFSPCNVSEALKAYDRLLIIDEPRKIFIEKYRRNVIMKMFSEDILRRVCE
jgi:glycosyltransferase involved in cell wall biosynthesis